METGTLVSWAKNEGDEITAGDLLCDIQTDKAVVGMEADEDGVLAKIIKPGGTVGKVGDTIGIMAVPGEDWKEVAANADSFLASLGDDASSAPVTSPPPASSAPPVAPVSQGEDLPLGPAVRTLLADYGLTVDQISGTGPKGSVLKGDVLAHVASRNLQKVTQQPTAPVTAAEPTSAPISSARTSIPGSGYVDIPVSAMRATIAKRLTESKSTIPHTYTRQSFNADRLLELRKEINSKGQVKVSVNDLIIKACAFALRLVPELNATSDPTGTVLHRSNEVDICVAVSTPAGLITPIVPSADSRSLSSISALVRELAGKAKDNKLQPHEFTGGSFTISNLGMYGIREFSAIINPPQVGILAVGGAHQEVIYSSDDELHLSTNITLTLSTDARFVDEAKAATFLNQLKRILESDPKGLLTGDSTLVDDDDLLSIMEF